MSTQEELEELFAYLDQLELQEKMDQHSSIRSKDTALDSAPTLVPSVEHTASNVESDSAEIFELPSPTRFPNINADVLDTNLQLDETPDDKSDTPSPEFPWTVQMSSKDGKENEIKSGKFPSLQGNCISNVT
jgi:hypothetical protein